MRRARPGARAERRYSMRFWGHGGKVAWGRPIGATLGAALDDGHVFAYEGAAAPEAARPPQPR